LKVAALPASLGPLRQDIQQTICDEAEHTAGRAKASARWLEDLERLLTVLEDRLFAALEPATDTAVLFGLRSDLDHQLASYRRNMRPEQLAMLVRQFLRKGLFEHYRLPRLSLFHMR
jgi:hypothetical protein